MTQLSGIAQSSRLMLDPPGYIPGWQDLVTVPVPAAGAGFTYIIDGRWYERVISVAFRLVTSAVVASRFCAMQLQTPSGDLASAGQASGAVPASTTFRAHLTVGVPVLAGGTAGDSYGYLPDILAPPGWQWVLTVGGIDVADQVDQIRLLVHRFPSDIARIDTSA